jgi:hypothetical protein
VNVSSKNELKFLQELLKKMGMNSRTLMLDEKEDIGLGIAIEKAKKGNFVSAQTVRNALRK